MQQRRWSIAPVVAGGVVYVGSRDGDVYSVPLSTWKRVWSAARGTIILGPDEQNEDVLIGMAIGGGNCSSPRAAS